MSSSRRQFIQRSAIGLTGLGSLGLAGRTTAQSPAARVERRKFGKIGAEVSILGLGLGSAFTRPAKLDHAAAHVLLERALAAGVNYWDTSHNYSDSEIIIGPVVEEHRESIYLVSKSAERSYDGFRRQLETSLRRMKTDHIDLYHLHNLRPKDDLAEIERGACRAAREAKAEGTIGAFGVTGHSGAQVLIDAVERFDPDALLTIFPADRPDNGAYEEKLLPLAVERDLGVVGMKTVRQARNSDLIGADLIRYGLSLEGVASVIVGLDTLAHLEENIQMASNFQPLDLAARGTMHDVVRTCLAGMVAPWDVPGYRDGHLV